MSADFWPWGRAPSSSVIYGCKLLLSVRTLCGLSWGCIFTKKLSGFFSQDLRGSDNLGTNFYVNFSAWGTPAFPGPHEGRLVVTNYQGKCFFPLRVLPEIEKVPCCLFLWGEFLLVHLFSESITLLGSWLNRRISVLLPHLVASPVSFTHKPLCNQNGNDLQSNRNLSTCFSDFYGGMRVSLPSLKEKKKSLLYFWAVSWGLVDSGL